jgi:D-amino-acid dehydrogenase
VKVLVLGAGVVGTAAAYFLNEAGHEVTVVERNAGAGLETSFANGGIVSAYTARPWAHPEVPGMLIKWFGREDAPYLFRLRPDLAQWGWALRFLRQCTQARFEQTQATSLRLSTYSYDCLKALRAKEDLAYDQRTDGVLHLYREAKSLDSSYAFETRSADTRFHPKRLDRDGLLRTEPALEQTIDQFAGALFFPQDESGDAHKFTVGLAGVAASQGVTFRYGETVRGLKSAGGAVTGVETDKGTIEAEAVVMSLGSYSPLFLKRLGIRVPIYPLKGYSVTIPTTGYNGVPTHGIHDGHRRIVMSRLGDRLRCAGTAELDGYNTTIRPERAKGTLDAAMAVFPSGGDASKAQSWIGFRPMTPDCVPILGKTKLRGLYMNTGHGSTGWTYSSGSGRIIADMVSGREPEIDLAGLTVDRF